MKIIRIRNRPLLLGTRLRHGIHRVVDLAPVPKHVKTAIKTCGGCARRAAALDKLTSG